MRRSLAFRALAFVGILLAGILLGAPPTAALDTGPVLELAHLSPLALPAGGLIPVAPTSAESTAIAAVAKPGVVSTAEIVHVNHDVASAHLRPEPVPLRPDPGNAQLASVDLVLLAQPPNRT
jgi:hypothetical protein